MNLQQRALAIFSLLFIYTSIAHAQFIANKGQWNHDVAFKMELPNGAIWFQENGWWISIFSETQFHAMHEKMHDRETLPTEEEMTIDGHAVFVRFDGNVQQPIIRGQHQRQGHHNYFLGKNRSAWAGHVPLFDSVIYEGIYDGVDLIITQQNGLPKMTYVVSPGSDARQIQLTYLGNRGLSSNVEKGEVIVRTSVGDITESGLYTFQHTGAAEKEVSSRFELRDGRLGFVIGSYDQQRTLYIDPVVVASTNSGSTATCYGHTATFDNPGNVYAAGRCFNVGYPTDTGSFQMNFAAGGVDNGISKYSPDGSQLIYSTYLGGSGTDLPHSMFVNAQGRLHVLGSTNSADFPVSTTAYDTSHNGGNDIVITVFTDDGGDIVGSTFLGGDGSDGVNSVAFNYGDAYRGEVIADGFNYVYVSSMTSSQNFPATGGVLQDTLSGGQDAVVMKLNFNLSQLEWSTFLGGEGNDVAYGIKLDDELNPYVSGSTQGQGFPVDSTGDGAHPTYIGGDYDGFILKLNNDADAIVYSSYYGTADRDQNFFVQVDQQGDVYLFGQSNGSISSSTGIYQGPTLGSYIYKTSAELDTIHWASGFGDMAPTAFLVDLCSHIYIAGHGGLSQMFATDFDTVDAVLPSDGLGFYLMALSPDATTIEFGSFYGNGGSHVDGGTSRFDKRGFVYEATCSSGTFPTTSWAYSPNNQAGSWDVTVFKIDFEVDGVVAYAGAAPDNVGCVPFDVQFTNLGSTGSIHFWDFGDGSTSTDSMPSHLYDSVGVYEVTYVSSDSVGCNLVDTSTLYITVLDTIAPSIGWDSTDCADSVRLYTDAQYADILWSTGQTSSEIWVDGGGEYWVEVSSQCGTFYDTLDVAFLPAFNFELIADTGICDPAFQLNGPSGAVSYLWSTGDTTQSLTVPATGTYSLVASNGACTDTDAVNITVSYTNFSTTDTVVCEDSVMLSVESPLGTISWSTGDTTTSITVDTNGTYWVTLSNGYCNTYDTIDVTISPLSVELPPDTSICSPLEIKPIASGYATYAWSTGSADTAIVVNDSGAVWLEVSNGVCTARDTMFVTLVLFNPPSNNLQYYCDTLSTFIQTTGPAGASFLWSNGDTSNVIYVDQSGTYTVTIADGACSWRDTFNVTFGTSPEIELADIEMCHGDSYMIELDTGYSAYLWSNTSASNKRVIGDSGTHWVVVNNDGCETREEFHVSFLNPSTIVANHIPNVITPNKDGINDALYINIRDYSVYTAWRIDVYNRWGERVFHSEAPTLSWDGSTSFGEPLKEGTYYYVVEGTTICLQKEQVLYRGSINILR